MLPCLMTMCNEVNMSDILNTLKSHSIYVTKTTMVTEAQYK